MAAKANDTVGATSGSSLPIDLRWVRDKGHFVLTRMGHQRRSQMVAMRNKCGVSNQRRPFYCAIHSLSYSAIQEED